jgi:hypothetical protein
VRQISACFLDLAHENAERFLNLAGEATCRRERRVELNRARRAIGWLEQNEQVEPEAIAELRARADRLTPEAESA